MRAFKKLMAGMIATAIAATLATSAFAAELTDAGKVAVTADEFTAEGQTTVLIVPATVWESETPLAGLTDADILYIDQYEDAATANAAIVAGFGVKLNEEGTLDEGNYYALFGSKSGDDFAITDVAFEVKAAGSEPTIVLGDISGNGNVGAEDGTYIAKIMAKMLLEADLTEAQIAAANVDTTDGVMSGYTAITAADGTKMAKYLAKQIDNFN